MLRKQNHQKGFTLLELLVVISIIAILIGLSTVSFTTAQRKSRNSKRRGDMKAVQNAFEQYYASNNSYTSGGSCATMAAALSNGLPTDPKNTSPYTYTFSCSSDSAYCICANLESETGNSDTTGCTYTGSGTKSYFCLSQLQ